MGRISHSTCVPDRFTGIIPHTRKQLLTQTRFKNLLLFFFAVFNNSSQCSFICWPHPAVILGYRSTHERRRCSSDSLSVHPSITPWTMSCTSRRRVHQKHKGATGGLHGHAGPIIYIDSPCAFEKCRVGRIQYPAQRFYHESLLFHFHLPIFAAVCGNQRRPSSRAIIAHHSVAVELIFPQAALRLWLVVCWKWICYYDDDNYSRNIAAFTSCFLRGLTCLII